MHAKTVALLEGANYATLSFPTKDGAVASHMMWVGTDGDHVLINTEVHRFKFKHLSVGTRATVLVFESPYVWAEVRGTVVAHVHGQPARDHIDELSQLYVGKPYGMPIQSERVIVRIRPDYDMAFPPG